MSSDGPLGARIDGAEYPTFYVPDLASAKAFYEQVFGAVEYTENDDLLGIRLGDTWLTFFPTKLGPHPDVDGPRNAEFAVRMKSPGDVDALYARLVELGSKPLSGYEPKDTWMYRPMRFCCVDDPFGIRIDVFCPLPQTEAGADEQGFG